MDRKRHYLMERPPRLAALLLRMALRGERREAVCGDLEEEWREQMRQRGKRAARRWFWRGAWQSVFRERILASETPEARERRIDKGGQMEMLWQDVKYAARGLARTPGFTAVAVLTLALGLGANTAIFSLVEAALLRPLPYRDPERLVHLWETRTNRAGHRMEASYPNYLDWRAQNTVFQDIAGYNRTNFTLTGHGTAERVSGTRVTANFFEVLGVQPQIGRTFLAEEENPPQNVAVITHGFWQRRLGGDANALGATLRLGGVPFRVIGVLPESFHFAMDGRTEVFTPLDLDEDSRTRRGFHWLWPIARLREGVTPEQATTELNSIASRLAQTHRESNAETGAFLTPLREEIVGEMRPMLLALFAAVALLLLLACTNVANLLLARGAARTRELAIRTALGAARFRILRQLLAESMLLALLGGAAAFVTAFWGVAFLKALMPASFLARVPALQNATLQPSVFLFGAGLALLTGILFGLGPAWHASKLAAAEALKDAAGAGGSRDRQRLRSVLVVAQVSLAVILLAGTGLVLRSLQKLLDVSPGFRTENLVTMRISLPFAKYQSRESAISFYSELERRATALPGMSAAGVVDEMPVTHDGGTTRLFVDGRPELPPGQEQEAVRRSASPNYFSMMGIRLLAGRYFESRDTLQAANVVVLSETLAKRLFPNEDPVGRTVYARYRTRVDFLVVGVVADVKMAGLDKVVRPTLYMSLTQVPSWSSWLLLRSELDTAQVASAIRLEVASMDGELPVYGVRTANELIRLSDGVYMRRVMSQLFGAFGAVAILLAGLGLYGVINYSVTQRVREIGLRMALGARIGDVMRMVLGQGLRLALTGAALGIGVSVAVLRFMHQLLFGVAPHDPLTLAAVCAVLIAVALLACAIPARRAAKVDPLIALRYE